MKGVAGEQLNILGEIEVMVQYRTDTHNVRCVVVANVEDLVFGRYAEIIEMLAFDEPEISKSINNNINCFYDKYFNMKRKFEYLRTRSRKRAVLSAVDKLNKKSLFVGFRREEYQHNPPWRSPCNANLKGIH